MIVTLPAIRAIRTHYFNAQIEIMGYPSYLEIIRERFYANKVSRFDQAGIAALFVKQTQMPASLSGLFDSIDLIVSFALGNDQNFRENLKAAGARKVICHDSFPVENSGTHMVDHFLKLSDSLGISRADNIPKIFLKEEDVRLGNNFLEKRIGNLGKLLVALHPGSGSWQKNWPVDRFAALIHWLRDEMDVNIIIVSGPADRENVKKLKMLVQTDYILADRLPLPTLAAILQQCHLFIGNDSGISHLAAAMGIKTVAIFGSTDPRLWAPRGRQVKILYRESLCSPCLPETRKNCFSQRCLDTVKVEDVIHEIKRYF